MKTKHVFVLTDFRGLNKESIEFLFLSLPPSFLPRSWHILVISLPRSCISLCGSAATASVENCDKGNGNSIMLTTVAVTKYYIALCPEKGFGISEIPFEAWLFHLLREPCFSAVLLSKVESQVQIPPPWIMQLSHISLWIVFTIH